MIIPLLVGLCWATPTNSFTTTFNHLGKPYSQSLNKNYSLYWLIANNTITIGIVADNANGWLAFAFSDNGGSFVSI
jgi:hypothetical protein